MDLSFVSANLVLSLSLLIIIATIVAYILRLLKQPLIPAYIITGLIIGPLGLKLVTDISVIKAMSEIGVALLLFVVGLEVNLKKLRDFGSVIIGTAVVQCVLTFAAGFFAGKLLGFGFFENICVGLALAFSSTAIVIKLLSDKEEIDTLHGRIMIGILLVQDLLVVLPLTFLKNFSTFSYTPLLLTLIKALFLFFLAWVFSRVIISRVFRFAAKSQELLFLSSISMCFLFAVITYLLDIPIAIGAFIGGILLANLPYHFDILSKIRPLKDFFSTIFFVSLGMQIALTSLTNILSPLLAFLGVTVILKTFVIMFILSVWGQGKRTSFLAAIGLAQISEFGLILIAGVSSQLSPQIFSAIILTTIITITLSSYLIKYDEKLYTIFAPKLEFFEKFSKKYKVLSYRIKDHNEKKVILFGCHRMGAIVLRSLKKMIKHVMVIDYNPEVITRLIKEKVNCMYGDVANLELLKQINFKEAKVVISTIPNQEDNQLLLRYVKSINPHIPVFVTASYLHEALEIYKEGADYVIVPTIVTGERISHFLESMLKRKTNLQLAKEEHIRYLLRMDKLRIK